MDEIPKTPSFSFFFICFFIFHIFSAANDNINSSQIFTDGETLISSGGMFELGFFSPGNSNNRYLGIWFKNITVRTYVWVANRQFPLTTKSGVLTLTEHGILALFNHANGTIIWSSSADGPVQNPSAQLLDTGNLMVKDGKDESVLWQSFDYPSDVLLPGMSIGWNLSTGVETYLSSWRSNDDPSPGEFTIHLDPAGSAQLVLKRGQTIRYRIGPWNGLRFSGGPSITYRTTIYLGRIDGIVVMSQDGVKYKEDTTDHSIITMAIANANGSGQRWTWNNATDDWDIATNMPTDGCDAYNTCGAHGCCSIEKNLRCKCLDRFVPKDEGRWSRADWSSGCVRRTPLKCEGDMFLKYSGIKLPDSRNSTLDGRRMGLAECEVECSRNCSCSGYTQLDVREEGSGCLFYYGDLMDMKTLAEGGQDLYIRIAAKELESNGKGRAILTASFTSVAGIVIVCLILFFVFTRRRKSNTSIRNENTTGQLSGYPNKQAELPFFSLSTILKATDHFSKNKKLGEGGFGLVYKGMLDDGQEIAVKRLSQTSSQGVDELKNEVVLIAKLQHRNLVKLLGCCVEGEEKMLIYEFMPNSSLDLILFDQTRSMMLDWQKRFQIINGIAKGLLYLHQDSRLRIIHRDLKTSNVLLDAEMNPKISDFGLARSFGGNEIIARTRRVVGTYGYMSPEYAINGLFSSKSDVFSFGVLLLEIVSGKRNRGYFLDDRNLNLLGHAWTLYKEENALELVDTSLGDSFDMSEVMRSIHVGLLCIQKLPQDRPNMSSVIFMLGNEVELPQAKEPGFFTEREIYIAQGEINVINSDNQITITSPEGR